MIGITVHTVEQSTCTARIEQLLYQTKNSSDVPTSSFAYSCTVYVYGTIRMWARGWVQGQQGDGWGQHHARWENELAAGAWSGWEFAPVHQIPADVSTRGTASIHFDVGSMTVKMWEQLLLDCNDPTKSMWIWETQRCGMGIGKGWSRIWRWIYPKWGFLYLRTNILNHWILCNTVLILLFFFSAG
jgi:hypothetical protein